MLLPDKGTGFRPADKTGLSVWVRSCARKNSEVVFCGFIIPYRRYPKPELTPLKATRYSSILAGFGFYLFTVRVHQQADRAGGGTWWRTAASTRSGFHR